MGINGRGRTGVEAPHGQKRRADDDLKNDQRLAKRFDLLNLGESSHRLGTVKHDTLDKCV